MTELAWADLFSEASALDFGRLLALWPGTVSGTARPVGMSAFGDVYLERPEGRVERLDVLEGGVHQVAATRDEFATLMNNREWQEQNLLSEGVLLLVGRGLRRAAGECYAFSPHPRLDGKIEWGNTMIMSAYAWHSICAQLLDSRPEHDDAN